MVSFLEMDVLGLCPYLTGMFMFFPEGPLNIIEMRSLSDTCVKNVSLLAFDLIVTCSFP